MKQIKVFLLVILIIILQINISLANDNNRPLLQLNFDNIGIENQVDIYLVADKSVDSTILETIKSDLDMLNNEIRLIGLDSKLYLWDLNDKELTKTVSTDRNTGKTYPPSTIEYSVDGYNGILNRVNVENDSYKEDRGDYVTFTESKAVTDTLTTYAQTYYDEYGNVIFRHSPSNPTIEYSKDGFEGTLTKHNVILLDTTYEYYPNGTIRAKIKKYRGYYTGVVTKTVTEWESDWHTINNYTGYYEGEVKKFEKQEFVDNYRSLSDKYTIFVSSDNFSSYDELEMLTNLADSKNYLIANEDNSQLEYLNTNNFSQGWLSFKNILSDKYLSTDKNITLINQTITIVSNTSDPENDPINLSQNQLIHNPDIYDNNLGQAESSYTDYNLDNYSEGSFAGQRSFGKKGFYKMYQRVKDSPLDSPSSGLYSNEEILELYVHEKPIANCDTLYNYNESEGLYTLSFIDKSFDPDYQYSRSDKGITDKKIKYEADGTTKYSFPEELPYGDYQFEYYVKDLDGAWSVPFSINLTLDENPKVLTRYEVYYKCNEEVLFTETDEIVLDYGESNTKTFYAKDFSPAYQLISESSVTKTVNSINQVEKIYFQYEINEISPQIDIEIASNKMRDDGSIAAGYGFEVKAMLNNFDTDGIDIKTKWLKEEPYEWIHESIYTINNYYKMQRQSGNVYILEPNPDSSSGLKQIFIPVELSDGLYSGLVIVNNIKKPVYEIDTNGQLVHIRDDYISIQTPFSVKVRGTMYEDFNIVN